MVSSLKIISGADVDLLRRVNSEHLCLRTPPGTHTPSFVCTVPDSGVVAPDAEASGFRLKLVGALVFFDGGAGAPFLHVHALAAVRRDGVAADPVAVAAVLSVCPLRE